RFTRSARACLPYGLQDLLVAGAPTQVPGQRLPDLFVRRLGVTADQVVRGHHEPRGAESALHRTTVDEGLLYRVQLVTVGKPLDGTHLTALDLACGNHARAGGHTVDVDGARTTFALFAGVLRSRESQPLTQDVQQALAFPHVVGRKLLPIDRHIHAHAWTPPWR